VLGLVASAVPAGTLLEQVRASAGDRPIGDGQVAQTLIWA
jgi:hypothetical protein